MVLAKISTLASIQLDCCTTESSADTPYVWRCLSRLFMLKYVARWNFIFTHEAPNVTEVTVSSPRLNWKFCKLQPFTALDINYVVWDAQRMTLSEWVSVSVNANCCGSHAWSCVGVPEWAFLPLSSSLEDAANTVCAWRRRHLDGLHHLDFADKMHEEWETRVQQLPAIFVPQHKIHTCWLPKRHTFAIWCGTAPRTEPLFELATLHVCGSSICPQWFARQINRFWECGFSFAH